MLENKQVTSANDDKYIMHGILEKKFYDINLASY